MTFGAFISTRRKEAKLNLRDTAKHLGISNGYLCDIEQGRRPAPEEAFVERISSFLELDNIILGGVTGTIWLGASVGILSILGVVQIEGKNQIAMLWLWLLAAFLNTVMQEMLVRGYLYQMIKSNGSIAAAIIVSTGLFTFAHGGAFEAGILPVLNVITMSLFMTAVLEYTGSLIAPIVIHFLWNGVGAIILGGVSLAEDYPHLFDMTIHGNPILSGGSCKIEGSIIVLFMNLAFLIGFVAAKKRKDRNR